MQFIKHTSIGLKVYEIIDNQNNVVQLVAFNFGPQKNILSTIRYFSSELSEDKCFELGYNVQLRDYNFEAKVLDLYEIVFSDERKEILNLIIKAQKMIEETKKKTKKFNKVYSFLNEIYNEIDCYSM